MKCSFCGFQFNEHEAISGCASCGLTGKCGLIKCPNCNFETAPEPKWVKKLTLFMNRRGKDSEMSPDRSCIPLTSLGRGEHATVISLDTNHRNNLQKMIAMGLLPRASIVLIQKFPSYVLRIGNTQFAIDKELADGIYVRAA